MTNGALRQWVAVPTMSVTAMGGVQGVLHITWANQPEPVAPSPLEVNTTVRQPPGAEDWKNWPAMSKPVKLPSDVAVPMPLNTSMTSPGPRSAMWKISWMADVGSEPMLPGQK